MEIKLFTDYIIAHPDVLSNKALLYAILNDLYPQDKLEVHLMISAYDAGITEAIESADFDTVLKRITMKLENEWAIEQNKAKTAVTLWYNAYGVGVLKKKAVHQPTASINSPRVIEWMPDNTVRTTPPLRPKKITGTRLPDILGLNRFKTPFSVWCAVTKVYEEPFVDNKYTIAGKAIEPKQFLFAKNALAVQGTAFVTPEDIFGADYFSKTYGDFFSEKEVFGGMWDYLMRSGSRVTGVLEMKTTGIKNAPFWRSNLPETNTLQAALYAWLLGTNQVHMVSSFLDERDYISPNAYRCNTSNTLITSFNLSGKYPDFEARYIKPAVEWWQRHVVTGISPQYDEYRDAAILLKLREMTR